MTSFTRTSPAKSIPRFPLIQLPKKLCDGRPQAAVRGRVVVFPLIQLPKKLCDRFLTHALGKQFHRVSINSASEEAL